MGSGMAARLASRTPIEVLDDQRRLDEHSAVVHEARDDVLRVELYVLGVVLVLGDDDVDFVGDKFEVLLREHQAHVVAFGLSTE